MRLLLSLGGVAVITFIAHTVVPVNATTVGFSYILLVLVIASTWGFVEALLASVAATLAFNYFFLPPLGTFTIADPQNWIALFSFLATAVIASRLSAQVKRRAVEAIERRRDIERLYTFSRSILLIESAESFSRQLVQKLADTFPFSAVVLYEPRTGEMYRAGPSEFDDLNDKLREAAQQGSSFFDPEKKRIITAVRLGSQPIAALCLEGAPMPDSVAQGIANLVAIGLERARAQELASQVEAARRSEQLRTTLIDAMAHEFKTPLTSIKAATTSLLASPQQPAPSRSELLRIADQEADHLQNLIDDAVEMSRLDKEQIDIRLEESCIEDIVREVVASVQTELEDRPLELEAAADLPRVAVDRRLLRLALKQLLDNALKYSPPHMPVTLRVYPRDGASVIEVTDRGEGIPAAEQGRIFERFYRGASVQKQIPGSGLGLSIADRIVRAHHGELGVESHPGETTFRVTLPDKHTGDHR